MFGEKRLNNNTQVCKLLYIELRNKCIYIYCVLRDCLKCNKYVIKMRINNDNSICKSNTVFFYVKFET